MSIHVTYQDVDKWQIDRPQGNNRHWIVCVISIGNFICSCLPAYQHTCVNMHVGVCACLQHDKLPAWWCLQSADMLRLCHWPLLLHDTGPESCMPTTLTFQPTHPPTHMHPPGEVDVVVSAHRAVEDDRTAAGVQVPQLGLVTWGQRGGPGGRG